MALCELIFKEQRRPMYLESSEQERVAKDTLGSWGGYVRHCMVAIAKKLDSILRAIGSRWRD